MAGTDSVGRGSHDIVVSKILVHDSSGTRVMDDIADIAATGYGVSETATCSRGYN